MVRYQTAFASTEAREDTADLLRRVHDAYMEGRPAPAAPREVIVVAELPTRGPGKVDRRTLRHRFG